MVKGSFWACVFAYVSTRVSHCTRLPFSLQCTMRVKRLALCAKKTHPEPNSVLDWNRGTLMRGEDGRHSISTTPSNPSAPRK